LSKTLQFRCSKCLKLLYKQDITKDYLEYKAPGMSSMKNDDTGDMEIGCPKCGTINKITERGLVAA